MTPWPGVTTLPTSAQRSLAVFLLWHLSCMVSSLIPSLLYFKSYVIPTFNYCDVVLSNCTTAEAKGLDTLFNYGWCLVLHKLHLYSASSARQELQLATLSNRRKFHMCQTMYKCFNSLAPLDLTRLLDTQSTHHNARASTTKQLNHHQHDLFLIWPNCFQLCWCCGCLVMTQQCLRVQRLPYFLQTVQYMTYFSIPKLLCMNPVYISLLFHMYWWPYVYNYWI